MMDEVPCRYVMPFDPHNKLRNWVFISSPLQEKETDALEIK